MQENHNTDNQHNTEQAGTPESVPPAMEQGQDQALLVCKKELENWKEKFIHVSADLENFSKRVDKERVQWRTAGQASILTGLLSIVDDFDRAFEQLNKQGSDAQTGTWITGFELIHKALHKFLESHEVIEIKTNMPFDTQYHEALVQVESPDHKAGDIVGVLQKGYTFKGQVLRVAKVSVAK